MRKVLYILSFILFLSCSHHQNAEMFLEKAQARDWWRNGDGQSLMIDINSLNLSNVHLSDFNNNVLNINFAGKDFNITNINDALVYGNIQLKQKLEILSMAQAHLI